MEKRPRWLDLLCNVVPKRHRVDKSVPVRYTQVKFSGRALAALPYHARGVP